MAGRWGSYFQSAVTGLEARLDTILAEETDANKNSNKSAQAAAAAQQTTAASDTGPAASPAAAPSSEASSSTKPSPTPSRSASTNRKPDRLQERLARAVAAKNAASTQKPDTSSARQSTTSSPRQSLDVPARASIDSVDSSSIAGQKGPGSTASPRASLDVSKRPSVEVTNAETKPVSEAAGVKAQAEEKEGDGKLGESAVTEAAPRSSTGFLTPAPEIAATETAVEVIKPEVQDAITPDVRTSLDQQSEPASTDAHRQNQEEIHDYVEKIDALQAKLQYLAREASDAAKKAIQAAPPGSLEKKLAEKDQQIALLMEEGKKLGVTEQKHRTIMKKLRAKIAEDEKEMNELKAARSKADAEAESLRRQGRRANDLEKFHEESLKRIGQLQKDINGLRAESASKDSTIADLKSQLQQAQEAADAQNAKATDQALEKERRRAQDLEDEVAALKVEKTLASDRAKAQAGDLQEKLERANERARVVEAELKAEAQALEGKLEAMRARAEEASSGAVGDSQAKLLRQIETLQTQYAIASENWQGIEATLLGRIANLEKERDEALQRESDMRKKAREAALRAKRNEEELEEARSNLPTVQDDIESYKSQIKALEKRAEQAEAALAEAKTDFEKQKAIWKEEQRQAERSASADQRDWLEDLPPPNAPFKTNSRPESPLLSLPNRNWSSDVIGFQNMLGKVRKPSAPSSNGDGVGESSYRPSTAGRRPSASPWIPQQAHRPSIAASSVPPGLQTPATPFSVSMEQLAEYEPTEAAASTHQVVQDMVSVSTAGAGPTVQLVERMSAQVRRLENEKVKAREELARMSRQRDEARAEIVALMRETEAGRSAKERVAALEAEVAAVNQRYETTLELLGEKSEEVEELKADVQDVKAMYRDLIDRTHK
ncbi:M protein repeat protein [Pyricularia oryzae 70-15]|uniref:M protein repeat protein n=2 Tax=Pyricularia oryzae TaxID=318829 RepID=G4MNI5_PYRO7|nr:M protein repeat protein [Pyricularia oryzae 70-15]EHA57891.1 M protein repeat protein [Pyricularia oryzae 70-15]ELQ36974.1 M protein repeat protein [Pyricularia oryzae Y34]KAI7923718.1 M protein repeat protein [Pyricularia oryzae]KAI7931302.1 M protein repeat protein [Pyricularia oryzae]